MRAKADNDFVTEMDVRTENALRAALLGAFPEDEFLGEESGGAERAAGRWIVDPIDGTQSFMRGHHGYAISIAYEHDGQMCIGCVYMPDNDEMFCAIRGEGATLNGEPIHVSDIADPHQAIAHLGYGHRCKPNRDRTMPPAAGPVRPHQRYPPLWFRRLRRCCVACGRSEIFFELGLHIYDNAAGVVILEEAGGRATGWTADADWRDGDILATNGLLHDFMLRQLAPESNT